MTDGFKDQDETDHIMGKLVRMPPKPQSESQVGKEKPRKDEKPRRSNETPRKEKAAE